MIKKIPNHFVNKQTKWKEIQKGWNEQPEGKKFAISKAPWVYQTWTKGSTEKYTQDGDKNVKQFLNFCLS